MKTKSQLLLILIFSTLISNNIHSLNCVTKNNDNSRKYVISGWSSGFFSNFLGMLNQLYYAERSNLIPVIIWGPVFLYYEPTAPSGNAWEYYFEPVSHLKYEPTDRIGNATYRGDQWWPHRYSPSGYQIPENTVHQYNQDIRNLCYGLINKYIKIKPHIQDKVNAFYQQNMQGNVTIGIHLRGSDKYTEVGHVNHYQMLVKANQLAQQFGPNTQFFVATDEQRLLNLAKAHLNGKIIHQDTTKTESLHNLSHVQSILQQHAGQVNKLILGEEVLIDALLLARCNAFVHSISLVSQGAAYFNPHMPCYLVTRQPKKSLADYSMHLINSCLQRFALIMKILR